MKTTTYLSDMIKIIKILLCVNCSLFTITTEAQNRIPQEGEVIKFYPVTEEISRTISGFDCFYNLKDAIKQKKVIKNLSSIDETTKFSFSIKNRYKSIKSLTPYNEILKDSFFVNRKLIANNRNKKILILLLTKLSNNDKLILRIPCYEDKKSNLITNSMLLKLNNYYGVNLFYVNIPFINLDKLKKYQSIYEGTKIMYDIEYWNENFLVKEARAKDLETIISSVNNTTGKFLKSNTIYKSDSFKFIQTHDNMVFMQPCIKLTREDSVSSYIPVTYLVGNTHLYDRNKGPFYFFDYFFKTRKEYVLRMFNLNQCAKFIDVFAGKTVIYGVKETIEYDALFNDNSNEIININTNEKYRLQKDSLYTCINYDVFESIKNKNRYIPFMILKDTKGELFRVPCSMLYTFPKKIIYFDKFFMLEEDARKYMALTKQKEIEAHKKKNKLKGELTKLYGASYANFLIDYHDSTIERFKGLAKKYGKYNARKIIEGEVCLGWDKYMCIESIGHPTDINISEGEWGIHEQWVYETSYYTRYLYFENGKLTAIQD